MKQGVRFRVLFASVLAVALAATLLGQGNSEVQLGLAIAPVPLNLQPAFASLGQGEGSFPHSEAAGKRVMSLPMHPYLSTEQQEAIVRAVRAALATVAA